MFVEVRPSLDPVRALSGKVFIYIHIEYLSLRDWTPFQSRRPQREGTVSHPARPFARGICSAPMGVVTRIAGVVTAMQFFLSGALAHSVFHSGTQSTLHLIVSSA